MKLLKKINEEEIIEKIEDEEDTQGIKIKRYAFNSFRMERSIRDILKWVKIGKIIIPDFQREFVWDFNQSSKFIESILLGLPIPDLFMFRDVDIETQTEKYLLIDGLQRYTTIQQFVNGEYIKGSKKKKFLISNKESEWYKKGYESLLEDDINFFNDYSFKINVFDSVVNDDFSKKLYMTEIFERINTGSSKLSEQEVRNAIYHGEIITLIKESSKSQALKCLLAKDSKYFERCKDQDFVLRVITYYHIYNRIINGYKSFCNSYDKKISTSKSEMMNLFLYCSNKKYIPYEEYLKKFLETCDKIHYYDNDCLYTVKREEDEISNKIHEVFAEALFITIMLGNDFHIKVDDFKAMKFNIWHNIDNNPFFVSTTNVSSILKRVEVLEKIIMGVDDGSTIKFE